jgi:hypothetical protein
MATWIVVVEAGTAALSFATAVIALASKLFFRRKTSANTEIEDSSADDS